MNEPRGLFIDHARYRRHLEAVHGAWAYGGWVGCGRLDRAISEIEMDMQRRAFRLMKLIGYVRLAPT